MDTWLEKQERNLNQSEVAETKEDPIVKVEAEVEARDAPAKAFYVQNPELDDTTIEEEKQESQPAMEIWVTWSVPVHPHLPSHKTQLFLGVGHQ